MQTEIAKLLDVLNEVANMTVRCVLLSSDRLIPIGASHRQTSANCGKAMAGSLGDEQALKASTEEKAIFC